MQFATISALAIAALASATPAPLQVREAGNVLISLPAGCTTSDLAKCALHLVGTTGSCGAAILGAGVDVPADLACVGSASSTAANFDECKSCIPSNTDVVEN